MINKNQHYRLFFKTGILFGIAVLIFVFGLNPNWTLTYYSNGLYPIIAVILRLVSSPFPFALGDILYLLLIIIALWRLFLLFKKRKSLVEADRFRLPLIGFQIILILYISFKVLWGLNYSRPSISQQLHISEKKYSIKELVVLGNFFIDKVNALQTKTTPNLTYNIATLREKATESYQLLALKNPYLNYQYPSVKPVLNNWAISKIGIEGYYNPLSGEANVNMRLLPWVLPFVTCHEVAHQLGIAREDEANLVAYLAGINSQDINFQYAVNYSMLRYILFEVQFKSPENYLALRNKISPAVLAKFKAENEFWSKYNGQMSDYMGVAFDKFLKLNNQKKGIKSYQHIVIWLWNYHKKDW
jgi:hypothetical protein